MQKSLENLSDEELMVLYQNGDSSAFEVLYRRYSGRVLGYLQKRVDSHSASDLMQEIFLKVHKARHQYSNQYPFLPWLFATTRNTLIDFFRLQENKIRTRSESLQEMPYDQMGAPWTADLAFALESLPVQQRRAIELRYRDDWTFEQIASELETSPLNARQIISRAIRKLRSKGSSSNE